MSERTAAWIAWSTWTLSVTLAMLALVLKYENSSSTFWGDVFKMLLLLVFATAGALIASRRPANSIGWIFCAAILLVAFGALALEYAVYALITVRGALPGGAWMAWFGAWARETGWFLMISFPLLLFPTGRLPTPRWRPVAWLAVSGLALLAVVAVLSPRPLDFRLSDVRHPLGLQIPSQTFDLLVTLMLVVQPAAVIACAAAVIIRFRRATGVERQQLKWFAYAAVIGVLGAGLTRGGVYLGIDLGSAPFLIAFTGIPVATGIAILKYRLYDIDIIINRTLVYGALTACVVGVYIFVVVYLGRVLRIEGNLFVSVVAAGVVAVLFAPLHNRLQRGVNRLMYGERDDPYAVISRLGQRLEATLAPKAVLPAIVETVAQALKIPHAEISLNRGEGFETAAEYGTPSGEPLVLPLVYHNETVGRLSLSPRAKDEPFTPADRRLLEDLARHAGVAAYAVRLTADLQRSRERLVTAREEERRRLRRDLHDDVGPQLAALTMKIETARNRLAHDLAARDLLSDLAERARAAVADVRRSVHALRPPALDELGLVPALRETAAQYGQNGLRVSVEAPEDLPPLPAAVEVAAYRIAQEALTNVARHADARSCVVRFGLDEEAGLLRLEVEDDGRGVSVDRGTGVGLFSMRERAEELGGTCVVESVATGGTRVRAELPGVLGSGVSLEGAP